MRKYLALSLVFGLLLTGLTSCDDWEDDSWHPGMENGGGNGEEPGDGESMRLKEHKINRGGVLTSYAFSYNSNNRLQELTATQNGELINATLYTYPGSNEVHAEAKTYQGGQVIATLSSNAVIDGNHQYTTTIVNYPGLPQMLMESDLIFEAPCGAQQNTVSTTINDETSTFVTTYEYTDNNCSFKEYSDGELTSTITNDGMKAAVLDPLIIQLGVVQHNPLKIVDHDENSTETIQYIYNEEGYPVSAEHTLVQTGGVDETWTEEFIYY